MLKRKKGTPEPGHINDNDPCGKMVFVPVSHGEFFDKLTILEIKENLIQDPLKRANVRSEIGFLRDTMPAIEPDSAAWPLLTELRQINATLWDLENRVRGYEQKKSFGDEFLQAARSIYSLNDRRAAVKRQLNLLLGSTIIEEKEHS